MDRRSKVWLAAAALFTVGNLGGGIVAAAQGEWLHAGVHAGLMLLGAVLVWHLMPARDAHGLSRSESEIPDLSPRVTDRLVQLEQSVDAIAIEAERIGEGQRFITRFFAENGIPQTLGEGSAEAIEIKAREEAPVTTTRPQSP